LRREGAYEMSNFLLLKSEEDIEGKVEAVLFPLCFLLVIRVKATYLASGTLIAISTSEECIVIRSRP